MAIYAGQCLTAICPILYQRYFFNLMYFSPNDFAPENPTADIFVYPPKMDTTSCEYRVLVSTNESQTGQNISMCFKYVYLLLNLVF